mmetsp:Transcript_58798/g.133100  ORF Transcript_58798/g.133100 Transcript_58798/m.133100 type:complete len:187 (+) Transcript_58798:97-657(+)
MAIFIRTLRSSLGQSDSISKFALERRVTWDHSRRTFAQFRDSVRLDDEDLMARAAARDKKIREEHLRLNTTFSDSSQGATRVGADGIRRKRLVYRSKQRGWLEVDLLMGTWAEEHVHSLCEEEMDQYEDILNQETIDIFNFVTGKEEPPLELRTPLLERLREWAASKPLGKTPADYAKAKEKANMT